MPCDVNRRVNYNGHVVWDVRLGSQTVTFVLWSNGVGEAIWSNGTRRIFDYSIDSDGDPRLTGRNGWQFFFRAYSQVDLIEIMHFIIASLFALHGRAF